MYPWSQLAFGVHIYKRSFIVTIKCKEKTSVRYTFWLRERLICFKPLLISFGPVRWSEIWELNMSRSEKKTCFSTFLTLAHYCTKRGGLDQMVFFFSRRLYKLRCISYTNTSFILFHAEVLNLWGGTLLEICHIKIPSNVTYLSSICWTEIDLVNSTYETICFYYDIRHYPYWFIDCTGVIILHLDIIISTQMVTKC